MNLSQYCNHVLFVALEAAKKYIKNQRLRTLG